MKSNLQNNHKNTYCITDNPNFLLKLSLWETTKQYKLFHPATDRSQILHQSYFNFCLAVYQKHQIQITVTHGQNKMEK